MHSSTPHLLELPILQLPIWWAEKRGVSYFLMPDALMRCAKASSCCCRTSWGVSGFNASSQHSATLGAKTNSAPAATSALKAVIAPCNRHRFRSSRKPADVAVTWHKGILLARY